MSTLDYFFNIENNKENKKLFKNLYIEKSEYFKEMGKYPVIHIDFKDLKKNSYEEFYEGFVKIIRELYKSKEYIIDILDDGEKRDFTNIRDGLADKFYYKRSLLCLLHWLRRYYNKQVVVLIDGYDDPLQESYLKGYFEEAVELLDGFVGVLKDENSVRLAVLTSVLKMCNPGIFGGFNNIDVHSMGNRHLGEICGFTEGETKELLEYYGLKLTKKVKDYYGGYKMCNAKIYNPNSIINYIKTKEMSSYIKDLSINELIYDLINKMREENKTKIFELLEGKSKSFDYYETTTYISFNESNSLNTVLNLLYASGYLTFNKEKDRIYYYKIPNNEVKETLSKIMQNIMFKDSISLEENTKFIESILKKETEEVERYLNSKLESSSYFDVINESNYQNFLLGILITLNSKYIIKGNRESGILIEDNKRERGIIVELKVAKKKSEIKNKIIEAKKQIKKNKYIEELELDKIKDKKEMVIVFYKKKVVVNG